MGVMVLASLVCAGAAHAQDASLSAAASASAAQESLPFPQFISSQQAAGSPQLASLQPMAASQPLPSLLANVEFHAPHHFEAPCIEPPPAVSWRDYQGPFEKTVGIFGRSLERRSVYASHPSRYKPGAMLCTLQLKDKISLFIQDSVDPVTFLGAAYAAGVSQAKNYDPSFGRGAIGYGRRFGAVMADKASSAFFKDFAYPTLFSEDPRYYRLAHGGFSQRLFYAASHSFVAHRETDGARMFNFSEWLGAASAVALSNVYHPDHQRGFWPAARRVGFGVTSDIGFDVLREFWPEIARKFKLPLREQHETVTEGTIEAGQVAAMHQRQ